MRALIQFTSHRNKPFIIAHGQEKVTVRRPVFSIGGDFFEWPDEAGRIWAVKYRASKIELYLEGRQVGRVAKHNSFWHSGQMVSTLEGGDSKLELVSSTDIPLSQSIKIRTTDGRLQALAVRGCKQKIDWRTKANLVYRPSSKMWFDFMLAIVLAHWNSSGSTG